MVAAVVAAAAAGCAGPAGKSGGGPATVLRLAVADSDRQAALLAERLAARIAEISHGSLRVTVVHAGGAGAPVGPSEASAIRLAAAGAVELAIAPAGAFAVKTLDVLETPFLLVTTAAAADATTGPSADRAGAGLRARSLTSVALVPVGLERAFGFEKPLVVPADFAHVTVRAESSRSAASLLHALGARPVDPASPGVDSALAAGFGDAPASPADYPDFPRHLFTASNVALFPQVDVVAANSRSLAMLSRAERAVVRRAAAAARSDTIAAGHEAADARAFCKAGGTIVVAPPAERAELVRAAVPLVAARRRDPVTSALVDALAHIAPDSVRAPVCAPPPVRTYAGPRVIAFPPPGSYRRAFTAAELRGAGAGASDLAANTGVTTLSIARGGRFALRRSADSSACAGSLRLVGGLVRLVWDADAPCRGTDVAFVWKLRGRDLVVVALDPSAQVRWVRRLYPGTWRRVG